MSRVERSAQWVSSITRSSGRAAAAASSTACIARNRSARSSAAESASTTSPSPITRRTGWSRTRAGWAVVTAATTSGRSAASRPTTSENGR